MWLHLYFIGEALELNLIVKLERERGNIRYHKQKTLKRLLKKNDIVIVDFWAEWCGPCKSFSPIYDEVSEKYEDIVFGKIDTEAEQELAGHFQIRSIPTLMIFREQVVLFSQPGMLNASHLKMLLIK